MIIYCIVINAVVSGSFKEKFKNIGKKILNLQCNSKVFKTTDLPKVFNMKINELENRLKMYKGKFEIIKELGKAKGIVVRKYFYDLLNNLTEVCKKDIKNLEECSKKPKKSCYEEFGKFQKENNTCSYIFSSKCFNAALEVFNGTYRATYYDTKDNSLETTADFTTVMFTEAVFDKEEHTNIDGSDKSIEVDE